MANQAPKPMTWWLWAVGIVIAVPVASVVLGLLSMLVCSVLPDGVRRVACGTCGDYGYWDRRNSCGYHVCDECASHQAQGNAARRIEEMHL